jgi:hypothetical protein
MALHCFSSILRVLSKCVPRFLAYGVSCIMLPLSELLKSVSSFALCFGAKIISSVLFWFSLSKFEHIHSRMSERQDVSFIGISLKLSRGSTTMYHRRSNGSPYRGFHKCHKLVSKICNTEVEQHGPPPKPRDELRLLWMVSSSCLL